MGLCYKGGAPEYHGITDNISTLKNSFEYHNGYFGDEGTSCRVRVIYSSDPTSTGLEFYDKIAYGGIEKELPNDKGKITYMADGSIITFRPTTKSNDYPGVDINISKSSGSGGIKMQKIHFENREDDRI